MSKDNFPQNEIAVIKDCAELLMPPSEIARVLGKDVNLVTSRLFTKGSDVYEAYETGKTMFKLRYETFVMRVALCEEDGLKLDKVAIDKLDAIRAKNLEQLDKERRAYENSVK